MNGLVTSVYRNCRDLVLACARAALPDDRPSPLFGLIGVIINGGLQVWSFSFIVDTSCPTPLTRWVVIGIVHTFVNMLFAVIVMVITRRKIEKGVLAHTSNFRLFLMEPVVIAYIPYLLWEFLWMVAAAQMGMDSSGDPCSRHMCVQTAFYTVHLLLGLPVFVFTFMTEGGRLPRWRTRADIRWYLHNEPETLMRRAAAIAQQQQPHLNRAGTTWVTRGGPTVHNCPQTDAPARGWSASTLNGTFIAH